MVYILGKIEKEKCFREYSRKNNAFLDYENNQEKSQKKLFFSEEISLWFWSKFREFANFLFQAKWARIMCLTLL